ncbi:hypothetical protein ASG89_33555 [Paenibacillus sp. Soil766]|nr:hypothetical protein ASG89_33555 [Paenibacillus sp. Soil766]
MSPSIFYGFCLFLLLIIIILLITIAVSTYKQTQKSKDIEEAIYRLIEVTKENIKYTKHN